MAKKLGITLVVTVKNEAESLDALWQSILTQTRLPDEVIITDGGSTDDTYQKLLKFAQKKLPFVFKTWQKKSNISQGRNIAIKQAQHLLIAITDAGCVIDKDWLKELENCYRQQAKTQTTIAGYYAGAPQSLFEQAVVPYVLVMPDDVNPTAFLPATRSILLPKKVWQELNGFNEKLTVSEDYDFARRLVKRFGQSAISFCPDAVVFWRPRSNLASFFTMIRKMAAGDIQARNFRPKVAILFARYVLGLIWLGVAIRWQSYPALVLLIVALLVYVLWAITKNARYVGKAWWWLPVLQFTADLAVIEGTIQGYLFSPTGE